MWWSIEWKEWNDEAEDYMTNSDTCTKWEDVFRMFVDCVNDEMCNGATVTCYMGEEAYPSKDPVVLEYRP